MHDLRLVRLAHVDAVKTHVGPDRSEAAERLAPGELVTAADLLGLGAGEQHREVVARLGVPRGEDLALRRQLEQPVQRLVAGTPQIGGQTDPVVVHIQCERRRRGVVRQLPRQPADLEQVHVVATEVRRQRALQVAGFP